MLRHSFFASLVLLLLVAATCTGPPATDPLTITSPTSVAQAAEVLTALDNLQKQKHQAATAARAAGKLTTAQWSEVVQAENQVRDEGNGTGALLGLWNGVGQKPPEFDDALARLHAAVDRLSRAVP